MSLPFVAMLAAAELQKLQEAFDLLSHIGGFLDQYERVGTSHQETNQESSTSVPLPLKNENLASSSDTSSQETNQESSTSVPLPLTNQNIASSSDTFHQETNQESSTSVPLPLKNENLASASSLLSGTVLPASDGDKEDISHQEPNKDSSTSVSLPLKNLASSSTPPDSATPLKRPFNATANDEDDCRGREKKKKEEPLRFSTFAVTETCFLRLIESFFKENHECPSNSTALLRDFLKNWVGVVDGEVRDWKTEILRLKNKFVKVAEAIQANFNDMPAQDRAALLLGHSLWTESKSLTLGVDHLMPGGLEWIKTLHLHIAETFKELGTNPFNSMEALTDFITMFGISASADHIWKFTQALRRRYHKIMEIMLKDVGLLDYSDQMKFDVAKGIWGLELWGL